MIGCRDFFSRARFAFSTLTPLFLSSSSVSLSYFILAVPMRECLGKHSCMSSQFPIAILNGTFFFCSWRQWIFENGALLNKSYYYYDLGFEIWGKRSDQFDQIENFLLCEGCQRDGNSSQDAKKRDPSWKIYKIVQFK